MIENHKELEKLVKEGWKSAEIKYSHFRIYEKGDYRVLYDLNTDRVIVKYLKRQDIGGIKERGVKDER